MFQKRHFVLLYNVLPFVLALILLGWGHAFLQTREVTAAPIISQVQDMCMVEYTGDSQTDLVSMDASALQTAVNVVPTGRVIKVAGTCAGVTSVQQLTQTVYVSRSMTIQGGYSVTNTDWLTQPNTRLYLAVLDAQESGRVAIITGTIEVTLTGLAVTGGQTEGVGGGIAIYSSTVLISGAYIHHNNASQDGGGLYNYEGVVQLRNSRLTYNVADKNGGGLANYDMLTVVDTTIANNQAGNEGGGLYNDFMSSVGATAVTFSNNQAAQYGGGIYNKGRLTLNNSTISSNVAQTGGGALADDTTGDNLISYSTIVSNSSTSGGGGLDLYGSTTRIGSSILAYNQQAGLPNNVVLTNSAVLSSTGYNLEDGNDARFSQTTDITNTNPLLQPLAKNGGRTETHAFPIHSPVVEVIPEGSSGCATTTPVDQRGNARPQSLACEIGAYETLNRCFVEVTGDQATDFASVEGIAVQTAVNNATTGDTIKVAGICTGVQLEDGSLQTVYIDDSLTLVGGHTPPNWLASPNPITYPTTLNAEQAGRVVYIDRDNHVTLTHLSLTGGYIADDGGGLYNNRSQVTINNTNIYSNSAGDDAGGIYNNNGTMFLNGTKIYTNTAVDDGGGIYSDGNSRLYLSNTELSYNRTTFFGGGIFNRNTTLQITDSILDYNESEQGGGLYNASGNAIFTATNTLFDYNTVQNNGGGLTNLGTGTIVSSTIIDNASGIDGGGIYNTGPLQLQYSIVVGNIATGTVSNGGGIYNSNTSLTIGHTQVLSNVTGDDGGGLYNRNSSVVTVTQATFSHNIAAGSSGGGGGIHNRDSDLYLVDTMITQNLASNGGHGGGVYNGSSGYVEVSNTTLHSNTSRLGNGGGFYNSDSSTMRVSDSQVLGNTSGDNGGGLYNHNNSVLTIGYSAIEGNIANDGAGVHNSTGSTTISHSTIANNRAGSWGGGLVNNSRLTLVNSTVSGNQSTGSNDLFDGAGAIGQNDPDALVSVLQTTIVSNTAPNLVNRDGIWLEEGVVVISNTIMAFNGVSNCTIDENASLTDGGYNLEGSNSCSLYTGSSITNSSPLLSALTDNGGKTKTHALLSGSPAIDVIVAGSNQCGQNIVTDQRDIVRPQEGSCDIGAFEYVSCMAPSGVTALEANLDEANVILNWVGGADSYTVYRSATPYFVAGIDTLLDTTATTTYTDTGARAASMSHYYQVVGVADCGEFSGGSEETAVFSYNLTPGD